MGHGPLVPNAVEPGTGPASTGPASTGPASTGPASAAPPSPASAGPSFDGSTPIELPGPFAQAAPSTATATIHTATFPTTPSPQPRVHESGGPHCERRANASAAAASI